MLPIAFEPFVHKFSLADPNLNMARLLRIFSSQPNSICLDGNSDKGLTGELNRYSFFCADPIDRLIVNQHDEFDFSQIRSLVDRYSTNRIQGLPPFQGGLAGLFSYELNSRLENVPSARFDEFKVPQVALFVYDVVLAIDHHLQQAWLISQGWQKQESADRTICARERLDYFRELIETGQDIDQTVDFNQRKIEIDSPIHRVDSSIELYSDFSKTQFLKTVSHAIEYIHQGDIFQVNLSQRLLTPATKSSVNLYLDLRQSSPAQFSGYFDFGSGQLISASPERLVSMCDSQLETRPIKGTRRRTRFPEVDLNVRESLLSSEKDRAENIMIVDLMRNDLSRIAEPDSVEVVKLCGIEQFQNVLHLVSVIRAKLNESSDCIDVLRAVFPGGSITGAPKIRAMEIISELEPTVRGPYCGSLGYICPDGEMDFNILIRSITAKDGWWQVPVGGAIVSDSNPEAEYEETWTKAVGMLKAVTRCTVNKRKLHQPTRTASLSR